MLMNDDTPVAASTSVSARATLDAWREQGADRLDTVRYALIDALEQRASAHDGAARHVLDARIDTLIADYAARIEQAAATHAACAEDEAPAKDDPQRAFATLAADASRDARNGPPADLLDYFRDVWSKLSADQQVQQSLDQVPKNAGPLNSSSLVHRALLLMRELSPGYLRQFLAYADALSWIEDLNGGNAPLAKEAPRASAAKKTTRSRAK
ncbi:DUF2894 domain-containing protein [Paraburkholderia tropica]